MVTIQSNLWRIHKFGAIFIAFCLVGAFSAIHAEQSTQNSYSTLTIAAKTDKKSNGGGE